MAKAGDLQVLLVEDEPQMRRFLRSSLAGARVRRSSRRRAGREAIAQAGARNPDIILLDLGLPDMDGVEVTKQLREFSKAPIIVLSARGQERDKVDALDAGADDYLTKPFGLSELLARMRVARRHLEGTERREGPAGLHRRKPARRSRQPPGPRRRCARSI